MLVADWLLWAIEFWRRHQFFTRYMEDCLYIRYLYRHFSIGTVAEWLRRLRVMQKVTGSILAVRPTFVIWMRERLKNIYSLCVENTARISNCRVLFRHCNVTA